MKSLGKTVAIATIISAAIAFAPQIASANQLVVVATGGGFEEALRKNFYDPFTAETGIEIIAVPASVAEQNAKLRAMQAAGNVEYDVITTTDMSVVSDADVYQDIDCSKVPNAAQFGVEDTCDGKRLLRTAGAVGIVYDERAFPAGGPSSWADFWDVEKFPGARCLPGGSVENHIPFLAALVADGVEADGLFPLDFDRALAKLRNIKPRVAAYWSNYSQSEQLLRDGECVVSVMINGRAMSLRKEGFPVRFVWNEAFPNTAGWGIAKGAPNEEAAYRFLDFWMTNPKAHLAFFQGFYYGTAHKDVVDMLDDADRPFYYATAENLTAQIPVNTRWIGENQQEISRIYANFLAN